MGNAGRNNSDRMVTIHGLSENKESNLNMCVFEVKSLGKVYIMWIFEHQMCVCESVCVKGALRAGWFGVIIHSSDSGLAEEAVLVIHQVLIDTGPEIKDKVSEGERDRSDSDI